MATSASAKLRILVDANVLVSGAISPRFPYEVLHHAAAGDYQLVLSPRILQEAREAIAEILPERVEAFEELLVSTSYEPILTPTDEEIAANSGLVRDAKDIHVAIAAINAKVDYLISLDKDLTDPGEPVHQHVRVRLPGTFLREQMGWSSEGLEAIRKRTWQAVSQPPLLKEQGDLSGEE